MSKITDALTTKIGPAPAWVYGVGLGVGINVVRWYRNRSAPAPADVSDGTDVGAEATTGAAATSAGFSSGNPATAGGQPGSVGGFPIPSGYSATGGQFIDPSGGTSAPVTAPDATPQNNGDWSRRAFDVLAAEGYAPVSAQDAIRKYLVGDPLTASEEAQVSIALRRIGAPPEGAPSVTRAAATPTATAPTPFAPAVPIVNVPVPAAFVRPSWLGGARFVKGSGNAIYLVTDAGLEWVPSEEAFAALGGSFGRPGQPPANFLTVPDSALGPLRRVGTLPPASADPSLP
jgi:hypothetical protein